MPDAFFGDASFELLHLENLGNSKKPTLATVRFYGEIRGVHAEKETVLVCSHTVNTYDELSEVIAISLRAWVDSVISGQDSALEAV